MNKNYTTLDCVAQADEENGTSSADSSVEPPKGHNNQYTLPKFHKKQPQNHIKTVNHCNKKKQKCCCFQKRMSKLLTARVLFILCLMLVAGLLGYTAHLFLSQSEKALAESQFHSIAERALTAAQAITNRKRMGGVSLARIFSNSHPNADQWPNVALNGFHDIARDLITTSDGRGMGFMPIVYPDKQADFEDFAYEYFESDRIPNTSIPQSLFGSGVYGVDPELNTSDNRYHATGNNTSGKNQFVAPILQIVGPPGSVVKDVLLFDYYSFRGDFVDDVKACSDQRRATGNLALPCTSLSDALFIMGQPQSPGAVILQPIYPANDPDVFTGYITSSIIWDEVLENVFAEEVSGIECVLQTETQNHTYRINNGHPTYIGEGASSQSKVCPRMNSGIAPMNLVLTGEGLFTNASATYTLRLYPTEKFFEVYSTRNPVSATIGAVVTIIITSLAFLVYDALVRQEFNDARAVLEAKRQFMRYVSHEVRTPLNTVVMGLKLLEEEVIALVSGKGTQAGNGNNNQNVIIGSQAGTAQAVGGEKEQSERKSDFIIDLSNRILSSAESAVSVLNDLLNYDKIEMGELPLELTIVPIWSLIEKSMAEFILPFQAKKIQFTLDFSSLMARYGDDDDIESQQELRGAKHLPPEVQERRVVGDAIRLTQVLRNLTSNALKFTPENGSVTVKVSWKKPEASQGAIPVDDEFVLHKSDTPVTLSRDGWLEVQVKDSGVGLTEDQLSRLFQRGLQFNANELQAGNGSGLGLYIAKGICDRHGGSLTPSSEGPGKGTTFTLTLPLHHVPPGKPMPRRLSLGQKLASPMANETLSTHSRGSDEQLRILVVDDAIMNRKLLARLLTNSGHECDQAEDGQQAIDRVKTSLANKSPYQVILMDFEMPIMNGPAATKHIRETLGCTDTFIGGVTGNVLPDDLAHFKRCGADWVFCKPVRIHDLEAIWMDYGVITGSSRSVELGKSANTQGTDHTNEAEDQA